MAVKPTEAPSQPKVVRRFTDELKPDSDLAIQTKRYQESRDTEAELEAKLRVGTLYSQTQQDNSFTGAEIARQALQDKYNEFFDSLSQKEAAQAGALSFLRRKHRNSAEQKLAKKLHDNSNFSISQVKDYTNKLQTEWKLSNSKVATNFMKICQGLDNHKQIFQCFPSQTTYTSAICGAVAMVVKIAANYADVAEKLSTYVADLSESVTVCTKWASVHQTPDIKKRLSDIYSEFFGFFIKVATWYLKSKRAKLWNSVNNNFLEDYKSAAESIKQNIQLLHEEGHIENGAEVKLINPHIDLLGESLFEYLNLIYAEVKQTRREVERNEVGSGMGNLLVEMCRNPDLMVELQKLYLPQTGQQRSPKLRKIEAILAEDDSISESMEQHKGLSRAEALDNFEPLKSFIERAGGSDGIFSAMQAKTLLTEPGTVRRLGTWAQATTGEARILWIITPFETSVQTSAELTTLGVLWTAIQTKARFISYVCRRSRDSKAGVLAVVYSLILQLLDFQTPDDKVCISSSTMLDILDDPDESWNTALELLQMLLENTPTLQYCIISGLNLVETGAREMCQELVDMLFTYVRSADCPVRILFATSGQSRALFQNVASESKITTKSTYHQKNKMVKHTGLEFAS